MFSFIYPITERIISKFYLHIKLIVGNKIEIFYLITGPAYWGLMNPQWNMCSKGRRQSPINVEPDKLLYDPFLRHIHLDKHKVS